MSPLPGRGTKTEIGTDALDAAIEEVRSESISEGLAAALRDPPAEVSEALEAAADMPADDEVSGVVRHLDAAVAAAHEEQMSAAELMGMLFYYAHNVAQSAREGVLGDAAASETP